MSLVGGWIVAPALLGAMAVGHGVLVERACRIDLDAAVRVGVGLASIVVVGGVLVLWGTTAPAATPACAAAGAVGLALLVRSPRASDRRTTGLLAALGLTIYAVYAAPSLLTAQASIAGYIKLEDSATWLALTDHVFTHGRDLSGLVASSYSRTVDQWLGTGYPVGAFVPLGVASRASGQDAAGAYQAVIGVYAAVLALGLAACVRSFATGTGRAVLAALIAAEASLFLGYAQWGGIKEAACAALLPPLAWIAAQAGRPGGTRMLPALAIVVGGLAGVLGVNAVVWAGPGVAVAMAGVLRARRGPLARSVDLRGMLFGTGLLCALGVACLPALATLGFAHESGSQGGIGGQEIGNLARPLPLLQAAGLWPAGDFRFPPRAPVLVVWLALLCALSAVVVTGLAARWRRDPPLVALMVVTVAGAVPALVVGSPWVDAKTLAIVSPVVLLGAMALAVGLADAPDVLTRRAARALAAVLIAGCVWSTLAVIRDVYVAPRARLVEAHALARQLAGLGPTVVLDYEPFVARYLLRNAQAEGATDLRVRQVASMSGKLFPAFSSAEIDRVRLSDLWVYRTIVRRPSPAASLPPPAFRLVHAGTQWEAWTRRASAPPPLAALPLGDAVDPTGRPSCEAVRRLASTPRATRLLAIIRPSPAVAALEAGEMLGEWHAAHGVAPAGSGSIRVAVSVVKPGRYRVWVGGSTLGRLRAHVDDQDVGSHRHELGHAPQWLRFGTAVLDAGRHTVRLEYSSGLRGGTGFRPPALGPVVLSLAGAEHSGRQVAVMPRHYRTLCGERYDWIQALGRTRSR